MAILGVTLNSVMASKITANSTMTDEELILKIKDGDMNAFELLVDRHKNYAFTIAHRIVQSVEVAEEIIQDSFVKVYRSVGSFKGDAKFTTWFYRVVYNTAVSSTRKKKIKTSTIDGGVISKAGTEHQDEMLTEDRQQFLHEALQELSDEDKLILTLFYFDEMSLDEIAGVTSLERSNLKVKLFRARKRLALKLNELLRGETASLL